MFSIINHMFNIINGHVPKYSGTNVTMVHTQDSHNTRAGIRSSVVSGANSAVSTSFFTLELNSME